MAEGTNVSFKQKRKKSLRCKASENALKKVLYSHLSSKYQKMIKFLLLQFSIRKVMCLVASLIKSPRNTSA